MARFANADHTVITVERGVGPVSIPVDPGNRDYQDLIASGAVVDDYVPPSPAAYEVSKLTIVDRLEAAGLRTAAKAALAQNGLQQDRWDSAVAIRSDDTDVRALLTMIGADPDVILAPG